MRRHFLSRDAFGLPRSFHLVPGVLVAAMLLMPAMAAAQDSGPGVNARIGHIEGQGVTQYRSVTPVEVFPYMLMEDVLIFADLRAYMTNSINFGGNGGLGVRYYDPGFDRIFGASIWYDGDASRDDVLFHQMGISLETLAGPLDVRSNIYIPIGETTKELSRSPLAGSARYQGSSIVYSEARSWFTAMTGFDAEVGVPVPSKFADEHGIRVYGGGYHYRGDDVDNISGVSGRVQGNIIAGLDAQVQVTYDDFYATRAFAGLSWTFGALHRSQLDQSSARGRFGEHVNRNYTVVAPGRHSVETMAAINPATGLPYTVAQVSSAAAAGGAGTVEDPFNTIAAAQAAGTSLIVVQSGSIFTGNDAMITMADGQKIFGDSAGAAYYIPVQNQGMVLLPHGPNPGERPILQGAPGNAVTLASNTQFAGFSIVGAGGDAIVGNGVGNTLLQDINVQNAAGAGLRFSNAVNNLTFVNTNIGGSGSGIVLQGGPGTFDFQGTTSLNDITGPSVSLMNLGANSTVLFDQLNITRRGGRGMEINNVSGRVWADNFNVSNELGSMASALDIRNSQGNFTFIRSSIVGTTGAPGVNLLNNTGTTSFGYFVLNSNNGTAFKADNAGALAINGISNGEVNTSINGDISAVNGTAIDIEDTNVDINLKSVSSSGAPVGVRLVNNTGRVGVYGIGAAGSGGTIESSAQGIYLQNAGIIGFNNMKLFGNGTGIVVDRTSYLYVQNSQITNSGSFGIDAINASNLIIDNVLFQDNGGTNIRSQYSQVGSYSASIGNSGFASGTGDNVIFNTIAGGEGSVLNLTTSGNTFVNTLTGSRGLVVDWNGTASTTVKNSDFQMGGGSTTALFIRNQSIAGTTNVTLASNAFLAGGGNDTAFSLVTMDPTTLSATNNQVQFFGTNSTGFKMTMGPSSTATITGNKLTDNSDGMTGILFDAMTGPGSLTIEDNTLTFNNGGGLLDRGIILTNIDDTNGKVNLSGTKTNTVYNADTVFAAPLGKTTGRLIINNANVP